MRFVMINSKLFQLKKNWYLILLFQTLELCAQYSDSEYYVVADTVYSWEKERSTWPECNDMVLLYGGGSHRYYVWNDLRIAPYVTAYNQAGNENWMFDSYLFLEIKDGDRVSFSTGYTTIPANQSDWKKLVDYFFQPDFAIGALNKAVKNAKLRIGQPSEIRKIVIAIPEPIKTQTQWGTVEDGVILDFRNTQDRIDACKWYIDYVRKKFSEADFEHLELAGFYWLAEEATNSRDLTFSVAYYLNDLKYSFNWIPYFNSPGWSDWVSLKFNYAYLQPNYFFKTPLIETRLDDACANAIENNMDMEMEFDERILTKRDAWHYRLDNYIEAFIKHGIRDSKRIAYYQGSKALYELSVSSDSADRAIYNKFCDFVISRDSSRKVERVETNWSFSNANLPSNSPVLPGTAISLMSLTSSTTRNFAVGKMNGNDRVFLFTRADDGQAKVLVYDASDGMYINSLKTANVIAPTNAGNLVSIGDGELTDDGVLLLANVVGPKLGHDLYYFKVYMWSNELQNSPQVAIDYYTGSKFPDGRFGDKIFVTGNYKDGTACIYATCKYRGYANVLRWSMKPDQTNNGTFIFDNIPEELFPVFGKGIQSSICINSKGEFYYKDSEQQIVKYNNAGDSIDVSSSDVVREWGTTLKYIGNDGDDEIIAYFKYRSKETSPVESFQERVDLLRLPSGKLNEAEIIATTSTLGPQYNLNGWGDIFCRMVGDDVEVFALSATNGFGKFTVKNVFTLTNIETTESESIKLRKQNNTLIVDGLHPRELQLYSITGQLIRTSHNTSVIGTDQLKGIYLLRIINNSKQVETIKVII